jgi:hypothetical protein
MLGLTTALSASPAAAVFTCTGLISNTTINDTVVVPNGVDCIIQETTVTGNVIVQPGGALRLAGSTVNGSVTATQPRWIRIDACGSGGTLMCTNPARSTYIAGNLTVDGVTSMPIPSVGQPNSICDGTYVGGVTTIKNSLSTAFWVIGPPDCAGAGNTFNNGLILENNASPIRVRGNTINNSLRAMGNTGGGEISNNTIRGALVVRNNCPSYVVFGNTASTTSVTPCATAVT